MTTFLGQQTTVFGYTLHNYLDKDCNLKKTIFAIVNKLHNEENHTLASTNDSDIFLLTTSDINKWVEQIPTDTPFHNDFINHWNTYLGDNIKDITVLYTDWMRESFQLIFDNLNDEEIIADPESPGVFIIKSL